MCIGSTNGVFSATWNSRQNSRRGCLECLPAAFIRLCAVLVCTALQKHIMETSTNMRAAQPCFVVSDAAYDRMYQKLKNGSRFEWTFTSVVCEKDGNGKCICPKMMNVLKDDRIIRVANGTQKPVYKASEFLLNQAKVDPASTSVCMNISLAEVQRNAQNYVEYLQEQVDLLFSNGCSAIDVHINMNCDGWSGDVFKFSVPAHDKAKLLATIQGLRAKMEEVM